MLVSRGTTGWLARGASSSLTNPTSLALCPRVIKLMETNGRAERQQRANWLGNWEDVWKVGGVEVEAGGRSRWLVGTAQQVLHATGMDTQSYRVLIP